MNPIVTEERIRNLELMLYGGCPVRQVGGDNHEPEFVVERYIVTEDGKMRVERPSEASGI